MVLPLGAYGNSAPGSRARRDCVTSVSLGLCIFFITFPVIYAYRQFNILTKLENCWIKVTNPSFYLPSKGMDELSLENVNILQSLSNFQILCRGFNTKVSELTTHETKNTENRKHKRNRPMDDLDISYQRV